jgi:Flp pilus assembly pilin Flp
MRQLRDAGVVEFIVVAVFIAVMVIAMLVLMGPQNNNCLFCGVSNKL